ncbi:MAG: tRNA (guanosine(46)-N7)-methyltransferase TrmB [Tepidisphaeraceae bacterium]|jgi:tRNA (guanine-N7-)-methyltransferase
MQSTRELVVEPIGLDVETLARPIVWRELFGNDHPVELEIGMGKGTFLVGQAKTRPDTNFFGVEYARWFWRYASDRLRRNHCLNARTIRAEAFFFLREFVTSGSLAAVHIYFPDPWPKKRHHKRRLIQPAFIAEVRRVLCPAGITRMVTDHADYFSQIQQVIAGSGLQETPYSLAGAVEGEIAGTNFERKYRRAGRPFFALAANKID